MTDKPTLHDWITSTGVEIDYDLDGDSSYVDVYANEKTPRFTELWHLADYIVSSRCGPFVRLVPRLGR